MPTELTLTQGKARAFCPWQGKIRYCGFSPVQVHGTPHLLLPADHIKLEQISCSGGAAGRDEGAAWLQPSCWDALAAWQAGAMPAGTTLVTAFLFVSTFHMKGQGLAVVSAAHLPRAWEAPSNVLFDPREHGNEGK